MAYRIISADCHIDMTWMPGNLWVENAPARWRDQVPQVRDTADVAIGHQLVAACGRHLGIRATYSGFVHHDDAVWRSVRRRRLFMSDAPTSRAAEEIRQLTRGLVKGESMGHGY